MKLCVVAGTANAQLAAAIASRLGIELTPTEVQRFPDGEARPVVGMIRGADVYVVQPTGPPPSDHLLELALLVDACRRSGARRVTAVVPYFGYARQDRRGQPGQGIGVRVALGVVASSGTDRLVVVDPHSPAFEAMSAVPVVMLTATHLLIDAVRRLGVEPSVVVAPDLGAAKLAENFGRAIGTPVALVRKRRGTGVSVRAEELVGNVHGRRVIVVDDMITTGATIEAAVQLVNAHGGRAEAALATHGLFVGPATERLDTLGLRGVVVTDTLPPPPECPSTVEVVPSGELLADAIRRLYEEETLDDLSSWG